MLLCRKAINLETGSGTIYNKCYKSLTLNKIPAFALNNLMWIGDVPQALQELTLSEQKLIALVNVLYICIIEYISILYSIVIQVVSLNYFLLHMILL